MNGNFDEITNILTALFASITYTTKDDPFEHYFQTVIYLVFTLLGKSVECKMHTINGRIDCRVQTGRLVYLFEFKRDDTAENALRQIEDKSYTLPLAADHRKLCCTRSAQLLTARSAFYRNGKQRNNDFRVRSVSCRKGKTNAAHYIWRSRRCSHKSCGVFQKHL